jgi:hypothetical protein
MSRRSASGKPGECQRLPVRASGRERASGSIKSLPCFPDSFRWTLCYTVTLEPERERVTEEIVKMNLCINARGQLRADPRDRSGQETSAEGG